MPQRRTRALLPVLDGHNDTLTRILADGADDLGPFLTGRGRGHVDLPRARVGGLAGGFFAVFTPSAGWRKSLDPLRDDDGRTVEGGWTVPAPPRVPRPRALAHTLRVVSALIRLEEASAGAIRVVRTGAELRRCREEGVLAVILHLEGAECIDTRLEALDVLHAAGLRSLGPVWSRSNAFGHGVPFDFPGDPDTGPGLTAAGRRLVRACERKGIVVDVSHLNAAGFRDVTRHSSAPLVATHSCAWGLSPCPRNLTDAQLDAVRASRGVVGIAFHRGFLRADGDWRKPTSLVEIVRHARYVADRIGIEHVALGSDFDGATMPDDLPDVGALPRLLDAFERGGFDAGDRARIAHGNWERVLTEIWGS